MTIKQIEEYLKIIKDHKTNPVKAYNERYNLYYDFIVHVSGCSDIELSEMAKKILLCTEKEWNN